jgi:oligopeptide/dipeptide ABC transporter ATP-binding protein
MSDHILSVENYSLDLTINGRSIHILSDLSFQLDRGSTLGLIGETGCGKTLTAKSIVSLVPSSMRPSGKIILDNTNILQSTEKELSSIRRQKVGYIPQNAMNSLDPLFSIRQQMYEILGSEYSKSEKEEKCTTTLKDVELDAKKVLGLRPFELSGGMIQRVLLALALVRNPKLIIADEITTALDLVTQIKILELMRKLQQEGDLSLLVITHDMKVARALCHEICVMYLGRIVEVSSARNMLQKPKHPYAQALIKARPGIGASEITAIPGNVSGLAQMPDGCKFHPRCAYSFEPCSKIEPQLQDVNETKVACHLYNLTENRELK